MFAKPKRLGWQGQSGARTDAETGLVKLGFRYYAPALGRFISRDPIGFAGGVNLYGYCTGDPVNACDASGLDADNNPGYWLSRYGEALIDPSKGGQFIFDATWAIGSAGMTFDPKAPRLSGSGDRGTSEGRQVYRNFAGLGRKVREAISYPGGVVVSAILGGFVPGEGMVAEELAAVGTAAESVGLNRGELIKANRLAGNAFRDELAALYRQNGYRVETEVMKDTPWGKRFVDIEVWKDGKCLGGIETKVGASRYHFMQRMKDMWLQDKTGYIINVAHDR